MAAPVALFVYNRLWHAQQTLESLRQNHLAAETDVIVFSDGPKGALDVEAVADIRRYFQTVTGFKSITVRTRPDNNGLAKSIISGITEVLQDYESLIVLEDDMITSKHFLSYMNQALDMYRKEERVISVHGYVYPVDAELPQSFFLQGAHCWGWATWRRGWAVFQPDGEVLLKEIQKRNAAYHFDYDGAYPFTQVLSDQIAGKNNSWAIRWHASAYLAEKLTLYPGISLVKNIGFDGSGTHSVARDKVYDVALNDKPVALSKISTVESEVARKAFSKFFKKSKPTLLGRVWRKLGRVIKG